MQSLGSFPKRAITRTPIQTKQSVVTISSNGRVCHMLLVNESDDGGVAANHDEEGETPGETEHEDEVQKLLQKSEVKRSVQCQCKINTVHNITLERGLIFGFSYVKVVC